MTPSFQLSAITGLGLVACIGRDVVSAAAAQRAGIARRTAITDFAPTDDDEPAPVIGASVTGLAEGFVQTGAWIRLGQAAIGDLIRYGKLPTPQQNPAFWSETSFRWILPEMEFDRFGWPEDQVPSLLERWAGRALMDVVGIQRRDGQKFFRHGPAGLASAVQSLQRPEGSKRIILLAVDSLLDSMSLAWLEGQHRLKNPDNQVGLCPGQGAACALLEGTDDARDRGANPEAMILAVAEETPPTDDSRNEDPENWRFTSAEATGRAIAKAVAGSLQSAKSLLPFRGDIYLDLNGETWKALAWGYAQIALSSMVDFDRSRIRLPIIETGDIGAANGLASMCFAVRSFVRGYSTGNSSIVCSVSDSGDVGAVVVGPPS